MAEESGHQPPLPGVGAPDVDGIKARAEAAERRAADLEKQQRDRAEAEAKAKRDAELNSLAEAKRQLEEVERREKEARERIEAFEKTEKARIDTLFQRLPDDAQKRMLQYRDAMPSDKFEMLVNDELSRGGMSSVDVPAPGAPAGRRRGARQTGARELDPMTIQILDELAIDAEPAKHQLEVEKEGDKARFLFPMKKLMKWTRERAKKPDRLDEETYRKLWGDPV
jgi:DNA repair exonuclease SbcCD ATPase subunit